MRYAFVLGGDDLGGLADMEKEGMRNLWGGGMLGGSLLGKMLVVGWLRGRTSGGRGELEAYVRHMLEGRYEVWKRGSRTSVEEMSIFKKSSV
ncbi:hypothetical protein [Bartonella sp. AA16NXGY]|uniref:hypothetical protein n=1 Tax=Bartonella sp. AA16NXGY TaxID=3243428 RepID=UPI0035CE9CE0